MHQWNSGKFYKSQDTSKIKMNMLEIIKSSLEEHPDITIITDITIINARLSNARNWFSRVEFQRSYTVCPTTPVYQAEALNELLDSLVPSLRHKEIKLQFLEDRKHLLLGALFYEDIIGVEKRTMELNEEYKGLSQPFSEINLRGESNIRLGIVINLFPCNTQELIRPWSRGYGYSDFFSSAYHTISKKEIRKLQKKEHLKRREDKAFLGKALKRISKRRKIELSRKDE